MSARYDAAKNIQFHIAHDSDDLGTEESVVIKYFNCNLAFCRNNKFWVFISDQHDFLFRGFD